MNANWDRNYGDGNVNPEDVSHPSVLGSKFFRELAFISGSTFGSMKPEIYKDEGYQLMGAAFEVYNDRGYGLAEEIYQECLEIELEMRGISFRAKEEIKCFYKGRLLKKRYIPDLFVFDCLV